MSYATETSVTCPAGHLTSVREASFHPLQGTEGTPAGISLSGSGAAAGAAPSPALSETTTCWAALRGAAAAAPAPPHGICIRSTQLPSVCRASKPLELTNMQFIVDSTLLSCAQSCSAVSSRNQKETLVVTFRFTDSSSHYF